MVKVYCAPILAQVEHMKNVLGMYGIEAAVTHQFLSAAVGEIPPIEAWPQLWVSEEDAGRARTVVAEAESEVCGAPAVSICPRCGEEVEGQFAVCWHCGAELP